MKKRPPPWWVWVLVVLAVAFVVSLFVPARTETIRLSSGGVDTAE